MKENMRSRRGVTLVEVVIALVVIGIISVATLTVIFSSVQIENKTVVAMDVRNQAENAIECFRFAKGDKETFIACLNQTTVGDEPDFENTEANTLVYVLDKGGYTITITVEANKDPETNALMENTVAAFIFEAAYENGDMIYSFSFPSAEGGTTE
ncbi:MAG: type II secretion system protein [Ruminococcaceae bacterium]|nr:type II secretion system protein [Oscillospiraceae bacterium]